MISLVETLSRHNFQSANIIVESTLKLGNLWLGDFTAAIDQRWQSKNGIVAVLTVAHGLNIEVAENVNHLVIDALDIEEYDIQKNFAEGCDFISTWLPKGSVLVHCAAGVSRSASMVICYLMKTNQWSFTKCYSVVKNKRKVICPNPGFIMCLKREEQKLGVKRFTQIQSNNEEIKPFSSGQKNPRGQNFVIRGFSKSNQQERPPIIKQIDEKGPLQKDQINIKPASQIKLQSLDKKLKKEILGIPRQTQQYLNNKLKL